MSEPGGDFDSPTADRDPLAYTSHSNSSINGHNTSGSDEEVHEEELSLGTWFLTMLRRAYKLIRREDDRAGSDPAKSESGAKGANPARKTFRPGFAEDVYGAASTSAASSRPPPPTSTTNEFASAREGASSTSPLLTSQQFLTAEMCASALAARRSAQLPKLKELYGGLSQTSTNVLDSALTGGRQAMDEIDFKWDDCDKHADELAEFYTYSELDDFAMNFEAYGRYARDRRISSIWTDLSRDDNRKIMHDLAQRFESVEPDVRLNAARILLYILQGAFGDYSDVDAESAGEDSKPEREISIGSGVPDLDASIVSDKGTGGNETNCLISAAANAYALYEAGFYQILCAMLVVESQESFDINLCAERRSHSSRHSSVSNSRSASNIDLAESFERRSKKSATLADNESLRVVISCLYHMCESIRRSELIEHVHNKAPSRWAVEKLSVLRTSFIQELDEPLEGGKPPLVILLLDMMPAFVRGNCPHYPIKKVLLLSWKVLLTTLGDNKHLREEKARKRREVGLSPCEDTLSIAAKLRPTSCGQLECDTGLQSNALVSRLGRKVRSVHPSRPFNRQFACASNWASDGAGGGGAVSSASPSASATSLEDGGPNGDGQQDEGGAGVDDDALEDDAIETAKEQAERLEAAAAAHASDGDSTPTAEGPPTPKLRLSESGGGAGDKSGKFSFADGRKSAQSTQEEEEDGGSEKSLKGSKPLERDQGYLRKISSCRRPVYTGAGDQTPKAGSPIPPVECLPWRPKVRETDIEAFLQNQREKFFHYKLPGDTTSLFGLPPPVELSVQAFRRNIYHSLGELQIKADQRYNKYPFSQVESVEETRTESLYRRMLPNMTEYVIALLKVILASLPSSKAKSDAVSILSDLLTPETDTNEMLSNSLSLDISTHNVLEETVRVAIDIHRHKELIVKAASAIIITILKCFRLNHIYQFENFAQYLVLANCLPLILKFLDQNIVKYFQSKHELHPLNYPQVALYYVRNGNEWPTLNADNVEGVHDTESPSYYLWRNVFSSVNLLRILNKLTKWKHARTMMLVVFKSAPVLKRCMRAKVGIFQLYVLKLLKMQARYLGRIWRKSNMDIISAIYLRVRHRLNDDWAFANETRSKSWDFQTEEGELGLAIKRFNTRRYHRILGQKGGHFQGKSLIDDMDMEDFEPVDNSLQSVLSLQPSFSDRFKQNYTKWVDEEVVNGGVNWDLLLLNTRSIIGE